MKTRFAATVVASARAAPYKTPRPMKRSTPSASSLRHVTRSPGSPFLWQSLYFNTSDDFFQYGGTLMGRARMRHTGHSAWESHCSPLVSALANVSLRMRKISAICGLPGNTLGPRLPPSSGQSAVSDDPLHTPYGSDVERVAITKSYCSSGRIIGMHQRHSCTPVCTPLNEAFFEMATDQELKGPLHLLHRKVE